MCVSKSKHIKQAKTDLKSVQLLNILLRVLIERVNLPKEMRIVVRALVGHVQNSGRLSLEDMLSSLVLFHEDLLLLNFSLGGFERLTSELEVEEQSVSGSLKTAQLSALGVKIGRRLVVQTHPLFNLLGKVNDLRLSKLKISLLLFQRRLHLGVVLSVHEDALLVAGRLEITAETFNFENVLSNGGLLAHTQVHLRLVGDLLGSLCVLERAQCVLEIIKGR